MPNFPQLDPDRPVASRAEDRLGRRRFAEVIGEQLTAAPSDAGFVIAIVGPWGSGKTSVLNMVTEALADQDPPQVELIVAIQPVALQGYLGAPRSVLWRSQRATGA